MNRILRLFFCVSLLAAPCLGAGAATVVAETEVTEETVVSTIPTMATEPAASPSDDSATIPEKATEPSKDQLEDVPEPEATKKSEEEEEKPDKQPTTKGASPYAVTLIEGVDIDAEFAKLLRTDGSITNLQTSWSGYGKGQDQLTDTDMEALTKISVRSKSLSSLKGIEYATKLEQLDCENNSLTTLDLSNNPLLAELICSRNKLTSLAIKDNPELVTLDCSNNQLQNLNVNNDTELITLNCAANQLQGLNVSNNAKLITLNCAMNSISALDVSNNPLLQDFYCILNELLTLDVSIHFELERLDFSDNNIGEIDLTNNHSLKYLNCSYNKLQTLNVSEKPLLSNLNCSNNMLNVLDVSNSLKLESLNCSYNELLDVNVSSNPSLVFLDCTDNKLSTIDLKENALLASLSITGNQFKDVDVTSNPLLVFLNVQRNQFTDLKLSNNPLLSELAIGNNKIKNLDFLSPNDNPTLQYLECAGNQITDITGAFGFTNLTTFLASYQEIEVGIPPIVGGNATVDALKTSASSGLSLSNISIGGSPILTPNGDKIELSNVTYADLDNKQLSFDFSGSALTEGASSGSKSYSGTITFAPVSDLESQLDLVPEDEKKVESGGTVNWKWTIKSINPLEAENVQATLNLPPGLVIDPGSIKRNGVPAILSDIDGTTNLGDLAQGETIIFEFTTTASGSANDWLKAIGRLDWQDSQSRTNQTEGSVQIKDDEQTYTPKTQEDMALLSVPESFRFGFWDVKNTAQTVSLHSSNYLTNTEVVSEGFYTRLRDDRAVNSGWKLSAQLSDFKDSTSEVMPNSAGTSLRMQDMLIESIVDRDTPAEAIDPTPTGVPSTVLTDETLVAGQTAKPLVTAGTGEGAETWQLRIPFDKVSLQLPANAGKKNTYYSATLTWSLDDTP